LHKVANFLPSLSGNAAYAKKTRSRRGGKILKKKGVKKSASNDFPVSVPFKKGAKGNGTAGAKNGGNQGTPLGRPYVGRTEAICFKKKR